MLGPVLHALLQPIKSQPLLSAACFGWTSAWLIDELVHRRSDAQPDTSSGTHQDEGLRTQEVVSDGVYLSAPLPMCKYAQKAAGAFVYALSDSIANHRLLQRQSLVRSLRPDSRSLRISLGGQTGRACCAGPQALNNMPSRTLR